MLRLLSPSIFCLPALFVSGCMTSDAVTSDRPKSYLALRYEATVPQFQDFTCGAASLATIATFYWGERIDETDVLKALLGRYTREEIAKKGETGLSFDDLIYAAGKLGFSAEGLKISQDQLANLQGPVIVHLKKSETFQHFVVLRKVGDGVYYLSDPVVGAVVENAADFDEQYTGNALAVWKNGAPLPALAKLSTPRDGLSVSNSLGRAINVPRIPFQTGF
jgi:predicted double-glycine peptidase